MIRRFEFSGLRAVPRSAYPRPVAGPPLAPTNPLSPLLTSLRGRIVGVMTAGGEIEGKLVLADPVTLVNTVGATTLVPLDRVLSVRF